MAYEYQPFPYKMPPGLTAPEARHKAVVVGAGPIGLALAIELANYGVASVVLDDNNVVSVGSRAICWSKRSLEILDRLGVGERCVAKGVTWKVGRVYHRDKEVFNFDLQPEGGHKMPAFINLQQYYVEQYLVEAAQTNDLIDLRFKNKVVGLRQNGDYAEVEIETPDGRYNLKSDYVIACDGAKSQLRDMMGLDFDGEQFEERFLIADIEMQADFPPERRFWFEPLFHNGQSALLHKQPDNMYRIDLQLSWDADPDNEKRPENVIPRIKKVVGHGDFKLDWVSVYTFQCRRLASFVHYRVIFAGDSAHVVSPFGARGGNGGLQDVDALGWRLAAILLGKVDAVLLGAYNRERVHACDENILNSTRSTRFMTPTSNTERVFRDQVLALSRKAPFARAWVNSGRLSQPCVYPFKSDDDARLPRGTCPGSAATDAPLDSGWLTDACKGRMVLLVLGCKCPEVAGAMIVRPAVSEFLRLRYLGQAESAVYLLRPDQIIAARWINPDVDDISTAIANIWRGG